MFEKIIQTKFSQQGLSNTNAEDIELIPVSSLEEVAIKLRNDDEENRYEYFLLQVKHSKTKNRSSSGATAVATAVPPPFMGGNNNMNSGAGATSAENSEHSQHMNEIMRPEKDDVPFLIENADLLFQSGDIELSRNIYRAILKSGESSDIAYAGLAACADREGLVEQAIQFAWDSVAFAPNQKGYQLLAQLLVQQGRDQEAAQALQRAIKLLTNISSQEKAEYYKMIGNCQGRLGAVNEAERAYKKALELSPASDEVQSNLGSLYLEQGQSSEAKRCYQDALAANPENDKAWVGLGLCYVTEGDKEAAHDAFARSLEKNIRNSTAVFHLVKCAYEIKRYSTAEKILSQYVEVAPVSPSLLYSLAGLQFHVGKNENALHTAKRILQMKADHSGAKELIQRIESI